VMDYAFLTLLTHNALNPHDRSALDSALASLPSHEPPPRADGADHA
jgi:hypothetical protein